MKTNTTKLTAALLTLSSPILAQVAMPTQAQLMRGVTPIALPAPAAPVVLLAADKLGDNREVPGMTGVLQLDTARMQTLPLVSNAAFETAMKLRTHTNAHTFFQVVTFDEAGNGRISRLQEFGTDPSLQFRQIDSEATCRNRVQQRVAEVVGTEMAEGWDAVPSIVRVTPMYRPDVQGVAYYEYEMDLGGFLVASTGEHDRPISNWSSVGKSKMAQLEERAGAETIYKVYKLDALCYVAENSMGAMITRVGNLPDRMINLPAVLREGTPTPASFDRKSWRTWSELKTAYADNYRPFVRQLRDNCADLWRAERTAVVGPLDWSSWTTYLADGGTSAQPLYYQHTYGSCYVGCGPVAWAILFCWGDRQAHEGNPVWSARTGLYRTDGGYGSSSTKAPLSLDAGVKNVTEELNGRLGTWCISGSGATWPSRMDDADGYLVGRTGATCDSKGSDIGANLSSYRDEISSSIRDRDTPGVVGTGFLSHYPVAYKYRYRTKKVLFATVYDREFYVNNGWGSTASFEWVEAGTFVYGVLYP
ncbi:MAG: hypothetical protein H6832_15945 [Planctomycetes bacterium]|nr:hypothetical protein [Planctomycetota bacterium]